MDGNIKIVKRIGEGAFGEIYVGVNLSTNEKYAIKLEGNDARVPQLQEEYKLYQMLHKTSTTKLIGIPKAYWYGVVGNNHAMMMDLLGPSVEILFKKYSHKFTLKTIILLANQMLQRLEFLHSKAYIHRDVKPENFVLGRGRQSNVVFLIDLGLAKRYRDEKTKLHITNKHHARLTGTARYASTSALLGNEQGRKDDLESLAYICVYLLKGSLPWQGIEGATKQEKHEKIAEKKLSISVDSLCKGLPQEIATFLSYVRSLRFDDMPDYEHIRSLLKRVFLSRKYNNDGILDWHMTEKQREEFFQAEEKYQASLNKPKNEESTDQNNKQQKISKLKEEDSLLDPKEGQQRMKEINVFEDSECFAGTETSQSLATVGTIEERSDSENATRKTHERSLLKKALVKASDIIVTKTDGLLSSVLRTKNMISQDQILNTVNIELEAVSGLAIARGAISLSISLPKVPKRDHIPKIQSIVPISKFHESSCSILSTSKKTQKKPKGTVRFNMAANIVFSARPQTTETLSSTQSPRIFGANKVAPIENEEEEEPTPQLTRRISSPPLHHRVGTPIYNGNEKEGLGDEEEEKEKE